MLYCKIWCFLKRTRFGTYFELPVGSSTVCKDFASKRQCFCAFLQFPSGELENKCQFRMKAPRFWTVKSGNMINMLDHKVLELSTCMKNTNALKRQKRGSSLHSTKGQTREIACFAVLKHGSSQLGRQKKCCLGEGSTEK